uniref:Ubinuclein 1 n=1 Tax=Sphaeramia orbicularis TaxID=375764 RepID=A0A672ZTY6_9TELE
MAESHRVQLTTLSSEDPLSCQTPDPNPPSCNPDQDRDQDTVRLVLTLFDPDERTFPEFNYSQLIEDQVGSDLLMTKPPKPDPDDLRVLVEQQRENAEMAAIAQSLEEKYGGKHKKKDRIQDLIDIGYGYDEEDSFIDNSEAYDEFVPASITTKFGGFYVNYGVLQFRQASDSETDNQSREGKTLEPSKVIVLYLFMAKLHVIYFSGLSEIVNNEMRKKKKKKAATTLSVTSMLKKFQKEKEREREKVEKANQRVLGVPTIPLGPADAAGGGGLGFTDPLEHLIGSTSDHALIQAASAAEFDIDLESLLAVSEDSSSSSWAPQASDMQPLQSKTDDQAEVKVAPAQSQPHTKTSLQQNIEFQCRGLGGQLHSKVYTHLSSFLPCNGETLHKHVKKLLLTHLQEPRDADAPMQKLKEAIGKVMPEQIACYKENCQCHVLIKVDWYKKERKESQDIEEYLKTLLDDEIKPLWPKGWMQSGLSVHLIKTRCYTFRAKKSEKKQPSGCPSTSEVVQGNPPPKGGLSHEAEVSSICPTPSLTAVTKETLKMDSKAVEGSTGFPTPTETDKPLVWTTSAHSPLDLLTDHTLAQEHPLLVSQELLAAAIAKYKHSAKPWSIPMNTRSPPPPPQSSPVNFPFPVNTVCQIVPRLLHISDPGQMKMNSYADGAIQ